MNKINVEQLLRVSKNTQRVPLAKAEGTIVSTLPADNVKVEGRDITIFGSKKDVDLAFAKSTEGFVSDLKPVPTTVKPSELIACFNFKGKTATIKFIGLSVKGEAIPKDQGKCLDYGVVNAQNDKLSVKSKDNGLEFDIMIGRQREKYNYIFDFTMDGVTNPEIKGREFILKDAAGNEMFSINGIHIVTENGRISTNLDTAHTEDGHCAIIANPGYVNENILKGELHIVFNVSGNVPPMITLESFRDGKATQPSNDLYFFGYKGRQEYMLKATIKASEIASELISRQSKNFETLFTLNFDKSHVKNFNEGFEVYDGEDSNLIKTQNFDETLESITIDITKKVKDAIEAVDAGKAAKDIVLEFKYSGTPMSISDDECTDEGLADNYVEIYGIYSSNTTNRPYIGSKFVSIGEVKAGTPFIEKKLGRSGKSIINVFEGSLQHGFSLGSIASRAFRVPFSMFYDSRLLTQKFERPKTVGLPKGWMFNLSQCLIKDRRNVNKTKGIKEVLYIDGDNNTHVLTEKWFYKDGSDREIVVAKDEVYLGNDQKLKYKGMDGVIHDVTYQVDSDDGLAFVSTNSKLNYAKQSDMKMDLTFSLTSSDKKTTIPLTLSKKGTWIATFYSESKSGIDIDKKRADSLFPPNERNRVVNSLKEKRLYSIKDISFLDGSSEKPYINRDGKQIPLYETHVKVAPLYKDGRYYIKNATSEFTINYNFTGDSGDTLNKTKSSVSFGDATIELQVEQRLDINSDTDIADYYENEDITNVGVQIKQCEDYINELQSQCESYSNSINSLNEQLNAQKELKGLMDRANEQGNLASEANEGCVALYTHDSEGAQTYSGEKTAKYVNATSEQAKLNDEYQEKSYAFQIASMNRQIEEQKVALKKVYEKINDYQVKLNNLRELKESYIEKQKEGIQDYIYDREGNLLGFDYYGRLVYLSDRYENEISLSYVDGKLVEISSKDQKVVLHYNKRNELDSVTDSTGKKTRFKNSTNTFVMTKLDEKGKAESTTFAFDNNRRLTSVKDEIGQSVEFTWNGFMVSSITDSSPVCSISEGGIEAKDNQVLSTTLIENTGDYVEVKNKEARTIDVYHLDYEGRLIGQAYHDEDDKYKDTVSVNCYQGDKQIFELSYEAKNLMGEIALQGGNSLFAETTIKFGGSGINLSDFSDREMMALSIDFSGVDPNQTKNNTAEFNIDSDGTKKVFKFKKIPHGILAVPVLVRRKSGTVVLTVSFDKEINLSNLKKVRVYRSDAAIKEFDERDRAISCTTKDSETKFGDFDGDSPTSFVTTDRYGLVKTSRTLFDANGRPIYKEDGDGNCKESYYDEKGNIVETREYNKASPSLAKVSRTKFDEGGNAIECKGAMRDKDGSYPQEKATYLPGTDIVSSIKRPNGQVMVYGYDFNTGLMTEIASDANGQDNSTQYGYVANRLVSLAHHGIKFSYTIDNKGRKVSTRLNGIELANTKYEDNYSDKNVYNGQKVTTTFADGFESATVTDKYGALVSTATNEEDSILYKYDEKNRLIYIDRNSGEETVTTTYNAEDQISSNEYFVDKAVTREDIAYDSRGRVAAKKEIADNIAINTSIEYDESRGNQVKAVFIDDTKHRFLYDALGRVIRKELLDGRRSLVDESIEYLRYGENSLNLVKEHDVRIGGVISGVTEYEYDVSGNIVSIMRNELETRYQYDKLGRLIREDNPALNKTIVYKYDAGGNILLKKECKYSLEDRLNFSNIVSYTYASGYKDMLTYFNGEAITYDAMGRPTTIGSQSLTWSKKGKLVSLDNHIVYTYGLNGTRTSKTVDGNRTTYFVLNNKILAERSDSKEIVYHYSSDRLIGFAFNGVEYIYERNIQGDVLRIYRKDNLKLVAKYYYDAYGNHVVVNQSEEKIGDINPFRYRGYYFDSETGWYYLNSRYYSPAMGRFISPDELSILDETKSQINGLNLYMYCGDNPVMNVDPSGKFIVSLTALFIGAIVGAVVSATVNTVSQGIQNGWSNINVGEILFSAAIGAIGGAIGSSSIGTIGQIGTNALLSMVESAGADLINKRNINMANVITSAFIGGAFALLGGSGIQNSKKLAPQLLSRLPFESDFAQTAINKYLLGFMSKKGAQGVVNMTFKKASFSLNALLKNTAKQAAIDSIPSSFIYSSISEFANWLFCRF